MSVVHGIMQKGCSAACGALPPPTDELCYFIMSATGLCDQILNWTTSGISPETVWYVCARERYSTVQNLMR